MNITITKKELLFPLEQTLFNSCHCSTFVKASNGDYLVAFFAGEREGTDDSAIWLSRCVAGKTWLEPIRIKHSHVAHWNPVLHKVENRIYLFYKTGKTVPEWVSRSSYSDDNGKTWIEDEVIFADDPTPRGPVRNKLIIGQDGSWLSPGSIETSQYWDSFIDKTYDNGKTWSKHPIPITHKKTVPLDIDNLWQGLKANSLWETNLDVIQVWDGIIQPTLWTSGEKNVHAFMRSTRGKIIRSDSSDFGNTWSEAYETELPNNNSGIDIVKIKENCLALIYNPVPYNWGKRSPISISLSTDNGKTFSKPFDIETMNEELSYPSINYDDNTLRITFTVKRKSFMYCECKLD